MTEGKFLPSAFTFINGKKFTTVGGLGITADSVLSVNQLKHVHILFTTLIQFLGSSIYKITAALNILLRSNIKQTIFIDYYDLVTKQEKSLQSSINPQNLQVVC
jgi:hypothetical protein